MGNNLTSCATVCFSRSFLSPQFIISTNVEISVCLCCNYVTLSDAAVVTYLTSFNCTFLSPVRVMFVAVKDSPKFDEPCVTVICSMWSGSITGTLYFGSPAELAYVSAIIKTDTIFTHQLTCYHTGCHLLTYSPPVVATHFTVRTNCHQRQRQVTDGNENNPYFCDRLYSRTIYLF